MSSRPLRFVQAGDFLLHQPLRGLVDAPDHLAPLLIEAPYQAAERVCDAALAAEVDFVLLTGNLCDPHRAGPRGLKFLDQQFGRLSDLGIAVYWAAGAADGQREWPARLQWPTGVHVFAANRVEHLTHFRDGQPICQIAGRSFDPTSATALSPAASSPAAAFAPSAGGIFAIAIFPGPLPFQADELAPIGNHFWAHGGSSRTATTPIEVAPPCTVHCAGTPQGRSSQDLGPFGCTMVEVDDGATINDGNQICLTPIPCDVVRWHEERIALAAPFEQAELERSLHERMQTLLAEQDSRTLLLRWRLERMKSSAGGRDPAVLAAELLAKLRTEYGFREPPAWTVSLTVAPPELPPLSSEQPWSEQQTLLGEFLRRLRELEPAGAGEPELDCFLPRPRMDGEFADRLRLADPTVRANVLRQAATLGAELLAPTQGANSR